ncbi:MAG TPA: hypothetical protein DDZ67_13535 [Xanthomonadaceae bacterium]|nr:hypothetical protein [Xanthomonadaceae bacterium]
MGIISKFFAVAMLAGLPLLAGAHGNMQPQHGGIVQMSGETVFELVVNASSVELYVSEDDEPVSNTSATAKLTVTASGKKTETALAPAADGGFAAAVKIPKGASVGVTVVDKTSGAKTFTVYTLK